MLLREFQILLRPSRGKERPLRTYYFTQSISLNLICAAGPRPHFGKGRNEGSDDGKELREFAKLTGDTAGMAGDQMVYFKTQLLSSLPP